MYIYKMVGTNKLSQTRSSPLAYGHAYCDRVNLRLRLARACVHLRWLARTCAHFGGDQICTQVKASFSPFGRPTQVNASWVTSINVLLANEIQDMSALKWFLCDLRVLVRKLGCPFGHPTEVSMQVQLAATCESVWPRLYIFLVLNLMLSKKRSVVLVCTKLQMHRHQK